MQRTFLLLVIRFKAAGRQNIAASAFFITCQRSGLTRSATHNDEHIHPRSALGTFDLAEPWGVLTFMTSV